MMPRFINNYSLQAIVKYYEHQNEHNDPFLNTLNRLDLLWEHLIKCITKLYIVQTIISVSFFSYKQTKGCEHDSIYTTTSYGSIDGSGSSSSNTIKTQQATTSFGIITPTAISIVRSAFIRFDTDEDTPLLSSKSQQQHPEYILIDANAPVEYDGQLQNKSFVNSSSSNNVVRTAPISNYNQLRKTFNFRAVAFLILLALALVLASYIAWKEFYSTGIVYSLNLVQHDLWSSLSLPLNELLNHIKVINVVITHTGGHTCTQPELCFRLLRAMQSRSNNNSELKYNFLIGGDEQTYEVRGWKYASGNSRLQPTTTLIIGFIGNYTAIAPTVEQLNSALLLIRESIRRHKLQPHHHIYTLRNLTLSLLDGEQLYNSVIHWPNFVGMITLQ